jgi:type I restriction enzyme R subunit
MAKTHIDLLRASKSKRDGSHYASITIDERQPIPAVGDDVVVTVPNQVEAEAVNKWLFNKDTVDKVLAHLMTRGQTVAGGDRLGKTILFAKNQAHAEYIAERFNANYPHCQGTFARVITFKTEYAQSLIDDFSIKEKAPHIAISVDMLDTGIDVPEVVNLVFFKLVRSKTKFWQMVGRGTRLCPELFGPGKDKQFFYLFDYCQNLEFFKQNPDATEGNAGESLAKRLFNARLELIGVLDHLGDQDGETREEGATDDGASEPATKAEVRWALAELLHRETAAMNLENFVVRAKRRLVEKYAERDAWNELTPENHYELSHGVAGLPTELGAEQEEAKRFDLLVLNLQLAILRMEPGFARLRDQVIAIAGLLEEVSSIPMVKAQMPLIQDLQSGGWWQDVTIPMLEVMRRRLRDLVKFIEKKKRKPIYTDFEDEIGGETLMELPGFSSGTDEARFRSKVQAFLREHQDHLTIHKLRMNKPLAASDLAELERMLLESGVGEQDALRQAIDESQGLGKFVRYLVGMDRGAAKEAMAEFMSGKALAANQIEFINLIVDHLTAHGTVDPSQLYDAPFTDLAPRGPDELFPGEQLDELLRILATVEAAASAA